MILAARNKAVAEVAVSAVAAARVEVEKAATAVYLTKRARSGIAAEVPVSCMAVEAVAAAAVVDVM